MKKILLRKFFSAIILSGLLFTGCVSNKNKPESVTTKYAGKSVEEILTSLTLEEKAAQMVQPAIYTVSEADCKKYG